MLSRAAVRGAWEHGSERKRKEKGAREPAGRPGKQRGAGRMKFMKLGSKPDAFQSDGADVR